ITGNASPYQNAPFDLPAFNIGTSTLAGGTGTSYVEAQETAASSPGTTANNMYMTAKAEFQRVPCDIIVIGLGTNDAGNLNSTWQSNHAAILGDALTYCPRALVDYCLFKRGTSPQGIIALNPVADATYFAQQAFAQA